jgi:hypothetical protein
LEKEITRNIMEVLMLTKTVEEWRVLFCSTGDALLAERSDASEILTLKDIHEIIVGVGGRDLIEYISFYSKIEGCPIELKTYSDNFLRTKLEVFVGTADLENYSGEYTGLVSQFNIGIYNPLLNAIFSEDDYLEFKVYTNNYYTGV